MMRRLAITRYLALLVGFASAAMVPVAAPRAADAEIARSGDACASASPKADVVDPSCASSPSFNLVKAAQRVLAENDYQAGPADGIAGPRTQAAVMAWQRDHDLEAHGALDAATLASMGLVAQ
jgi:hypothetical protein